MGRDHYCRDIPFLLWSTGPGAHARDLRLEVGFEFPEEWETVHGWTPQGEGEIVGETEWKKGPHVVEVGYQCLITRSKTFFASRDRASLDAWKRDHGIKGSIREGEHLVLEG